MNNVNNMYYQNYSNVNDITNIQNEEVLQKDLVYYLNANNIFPCWIIFNVEIF